MGGDQEGATSSPAPHLKLWSMLHNFGRRDADALIFSDIAPILELS